MALKEKLVTSVQLIQVRKYAEAQVVLEELHKQASFNPYVLYNLGLCLWNRERQHEAIRLWRTAIGADPTFVPAMVNLGQALLTFGDLRESLRYTQMAARRQPDNPHIMANVATTLSALGESIDGLAAAEHGLAVDPQQYRCLLAKMGCLNELNRVDQAAIVAHQILDHPDGRHSIDALCTATSHAAKRSDWATLDELTPRLREAAFTSATDVNPMAMTFCFDDPELMGKVTHQRKTPPMPARPARRSGPGKIRIGYLSPDFREHPVAQMMLDTLRNHDRSRFEIVTIGTLPVDASPLYQEILRHTDEHIDLTKLDDGDSARTLRERNIDVLVDLVGSTKWCRPGLLQRRPCPAQVLWLGCPTSTGTHYYDAFLVDAIVAPPGYEQICTEPLVRLPCCYHPISLGFGTPSPWLTREKVRLPAEAFIIGMLQQPNKLRPPLVDIVARTAAQYEHAHLWLRVCQDSAEAVLSRFERLGLPRNRVHFASLFPKRDEYLAIYNLVDVLIDSFPYGGHSTTGEALIQGTPVLTVQGRCIHARVASSMLTELGLPDAVCPDFATLEHRLEALLRDQEATQALRLRSRAAAEHYRATGPQRLTRALEQAYLDVLAAAPAQ